MDEVRASALALPGVSEAPHHDRSSFRVQNKIVATFLDDAALNVMVDEEEARAVAAEHPGSCELLWWGRRVAGVRVELAGVGLDVVTELLDGAWRRRAPARLREQRP